MAPTINLEDWLFICSFPNKILASIAFATSFMVGLFKDVIKGITLTKISFGKFF